MTLRIAAPEASLDIDLANAVTAGVGRGDRGRGLAGMRERAQTLGGRMSAGPDGKLWRIRVRLPAPRWRMTIGVLIVDDEELVRVGLRAIVAAQPDLTVLGEASDGAEVPPLVARLRPDVVLMDLRMPAIDGLQATRHLVATATRPPRVLVVTTFENDEYVYQALRAGASGFLLKRARPAEIVAAIRVVAHGDSLLFPEAIRRLVATHGPGAGTGDHLAGRRLTPREGEVLRLMCAGLSNAEIAAELVVGEETVKTHVGNVLTKLHARDRTQAVIAAYESGFVTPSG